MKKLARLAAVTLGLGLAAIPPATAGDGDIIKNAESAAPAAVASEATIYAFNADGTMRSVREGKNGYWCMPDDPSTPGDDPMCGDDASMQWAMAWMTKKDPPKGKIGLIYMLAGGSDASNTDPYGTAPTDTNNWIKTGRHIMIMNATEFMPGYPAEAKPDTRKPYIMWNGTPYAHLMVPVE